MIKVKNLSFSYENQEKVLKDLNIVVEDNDFLAIVGPSGSGKSTLSLTFNGIIPKSITGDFKGEVIVFGKNTLAEEIYNLSSIVGIVLQNPDSQLFAMTVEEELAFGPENLGLPREEIEKRVLETLKFIKIEDREKFPFALSGGEKQKLAIGAMLTMKPKVIVLDEPTSQLDPAGKKEVFDVLKKLHKIGLTIVLIEHDAEFISKYAKRVCVINNGRIVDFGTPREIFSKVPFLKEIGVRIPQVVEFTHELKKRGILKEICLNLEEAKKIKIKALKKIKANGERKGEEILRVENLSYKYPEGDWALRGVNLRICKGEVLAIIGKNGSGKTTLAKHFNNLLRPTKGKVFVFGEDIRKKSVAEMARKVGYVFQNPNHMIFADSVFEEVEFGLKNLGVENRESIVLDVLKRTNLLKYKDRHPTMLSGGEKQRLALASVLVMKPDILILDEPTTGLDLKSAESIVSLVKNLNAEGRTIILITHDMELVGGIARRVVVLNEGRVVADDDVREIFSNSKLLEENCLSEPQITKLSKILGHGIYLTVDEYVRSVVS